MSPTESRPNILIFFVDEMQAQVIRPEHPCRMPNLERFAAQGLTLTQHFTPSPHCCPSRATFASGLFPTGHGIWNNVSTDTAHQEDLNPGVRLYSEFLREAGYDLRRSGKWHVSAHIHPGDRGWQEYSPRKAVGLRGVSSWPARATALGPLMAPGGRPHATSFRPGWGDTTVVAERLIDGPEAHRQCHWYADGVGPGLRAIADAAAAGGPWCVCISTDMDYGCPLPRDIHDLYAALEVTLPHSYYADDLLDKPRIYHRIRRQIFDQLSEAEAKDGLRHYWGQCTLQDRYFGEILAALEATGQQDETLVLFLADHGDYGFAHGLTRMGIPCFTEAYQVPAVVRWPAGLARPGRTVDALTTLADWAPTFLELAGVQTDYRFTGRSLLPFLRGEHPADWPDAVFTQTNGNESYFTQRSVRTRDWKYVANWFDYDELYDLKNDPEELHNLLFPRPEDLARPSAGETRSRADYRPWPPVPEALDAVHRDLAHRLWCFARDEKDMVFNTFAPVAVPGYGPLSAFMDRPYDGSGPGPRG